MKFIKIIQNSFHEILYNIEDLETMKNYLLNNN